MTQPWYAHPWNEFTQLSIEVCRTQQLYSSLLRTVRLEAWLLKQPCVGLIRDVFVEANGATGIADELFTADELRQVAGSDPWPTKRFIRMLTAYVCVANGEPVPTPKDFARIGETETEPLLQNKLLQALHHAATAPESRSRWDEAQGAATTLGRKPLRQLLKERQTVRTAKVKKLAEELIKKGIPCGENSEPDPVKVADLGPEKREELRKDPKTRKLLVAASAIEIIDTLLGFRSASSSQLCAKVKEAIKDDDLNAVRAITCGLSAEASMSLFLCRDSLGDVSLHKVKTWEMYELVHGQEPRAQTIKNLAGQTPIETYISKHPEDNEAIGRFVTHFGIVEGLESMLVKLMLTTDPEGVSPCMRLTPESRMQAESRFSSWEQVAEALQADDPIAALQGLQPPGIWPQILAYHLFSEPEVWEYGMHTDRSRERLAVFWTVAKRLIDTMVNRTHSRDENAKKALQAARQLFAATKGPRTLDAREPYRALLEQDMKMLANQSQEVLDKFYSRLYGPAIDELRMIPSQLTPQVVPCTLLSNLGLDQQLRMDSLYASGQGVDFKVEVPKWVLDESPDTANILADLENVGMIAQESIQDKAFTLLQFATASAPQKAMEGVFKHMEIVHWYATWLRGMCQRHQSTIQNNILEIFEPFEPVAGENFFCRKEVKKLERICQKARDEIREFKEALEVRAVDPDSDETRVLLAQAAAFVCDINGATFVCDTPEDLLKVYKYLLNAPDSGMDSGFVELLGPPHLLQRGHLLRSDFKTTEYFEVHFDLTVAKYPTERTNLVSFIEAGTCLPMFSLDQEGHLCVFLGNQDVSLRLYAFKPVPLGKTVSVIARISGVAFAIQIDGREVASTPTTIGLCTGRQNVEIWISDNERPAADATIAGLQFKALDKTRNALMQRRTTKSEGVLYAAYKTSPPASPGLGHAKSRPRVMRVKNLFDPSFPTVGGYRDMKIWASIETPEGPLAAELQLLLATGWQEKAWMHLPYEYFRGSFDWEEYLPEPL